MKKIYLLAILQIGAAAAIAQKQAVATVQRPVPVNPLKDTQQYEGYLIRLIPGMPSPGSLFNVGFEIVKDKRPVVHQFQNAMPFSPKGIQKKEDAYKIAQWIIREYKSTGHWQNTIQPQVATQLQLNIIN